MSKKNKTEQLIKKLDKMLTVGGAGPSVSPDSSGSGRLPLSDILITKDIDLSSLDENQLYFVHVMLHKFYATGRNKHLSKEDIKSLHNEIRKKIKHENFDTLDMENGHHTGSDRKSE